MPLSTQALVSCLLTFMGGVLVGRTGMRQTGGSGRGEERQGIAIETEPTPPVPVVSLTNLRGQYGAVPSKEEAKKEEEQVWREPWNGTVPTWKTQILSLDKRYDAGKFTTECVKFPKHGARGWFRPLQCYQQRIEQFLSVGRPAVPNAKSPYPCGKQVFFPFLSALSKAKHQFPRRSFNVLQIGCGAGNVEVQMNEFLEGQVNSTGINFDFPSNFSEIAANMGFKIDESRPPHFVKQNMYTLCPLHTSFDLVISQNAIMKAPHFRLHHLFKVMRPGAVAILGQLEMLFTTAHKWDILGGKITTNIPELQNFSSYSEPSKSLLHCSLEYRDWALYSFTILRNGNHVCGTNGHCRGNIQLVLIHLKDMVQATKDFKKELDAAVKVAPRGDKVMWDKFDKAWRHEIDMAINTTCDSSVSAGGDAP